MANLSETDVIAIISRTLEPRVEDLEEKAEIYDAMFQTQEGQRAAERVTRFYEILALAERERSSAGRQQEGVTLTPQRIADATGVSRPHAYNLIEDIAEFEPEACTKVEDPVRLRVKWGRATRTASERLDTISEVATV